jgi:hypothetical protein
MGFGRGKFRGADRVMVGLVVGLVGVPVVFLLGVLGLILWVR